MDHETATHTLHDLQHQQQHARRAARTPWWYYLATFVVITAAVASNDFLPSNGPQIIAVAIVVALLAVVVFRLVTGSAPLSRLRGVQGRVSPSSRRLSLTLIIGSLAGWLFVCYGFELGAKLADALHEPGYPNTATGLIAGTIFTAVLLIAEMLRGGVPNATRQNQR
jgi:hypothetical protein